MIARDQDDPLDQLKEIWIQQAGRPLSPIEFEAMQDSLDLDWMKALPTVELEFAALFVRALKRPLTFASWAAMARELRRAKSDDNENRKALEALGFSVGTRLGYQPSGTVPVLRVEIVEWEDLKKYAGRLNGVPTISTDTDGELFQTWRYGWNRPNERTYLFQSGALVGALVRTQALHRGPTGGRVKLVNNAVVCSACDRVLFRVSEEKSEPGEIPPCLG